MNYYGRGQVAALAALGVTKVAGVLQPATLKEVQALLGHGTPAGFARASHLVQQPHAFEGGDGPFDLGHSLRGIGFGGEGAINQVAHPRFGINATKLHHPDGLSSRKGVATKQLILERLQGSNESMRHHVARLHGITDPPIPRPGAVYSPDDWTPGQPLSPMPRVFPAHHMEYVHGTPGHTALAEGGVATPADRREFRRLVEEVPQAIQRASGHSVMDMEEGNARNWVLSPNDGWKMVDFLPQVGTSPHNSGLQNPKPQGNFQHAYRELEPGFMHAEERQRPLPRGVKEPEEPRKPRQWPPAR